MSHLCLFIWALMICFIFFNCWWLKLRSSFIYMIISSSFLALILDWSLSWVSSWHFELESRLSQIAHIFNSTWLNSTRLIVKLSFKLTFWTWINLESSCSHFQLNSSWIEHILNLTWRNLSSSQVNSTWLVKNLSLTSRELRIET